ncbi:MAG: hypothetical protein Q7I92_04830 [Humidesulfovibrio sp.]|nr:hypothetical protein [Humidesulfovibrio sp.]
MMHSEPLPHKAPAATPVFPLPALFLALALTFALLSPCAALAAGALPWLAPGQQDNASMSDANATGFNTIGANATGVGIPGPASQPVAKAAVQPAIQPTEPDDADGKAQFEVLRQYFQRQLTLAEDFPEVFSRRVKSSEAMAFTTMCEMQRRRGLLERFRAAKVDISGLVFTRVTADPDLARIHVTGRYSFTLRPKALTLADPKENSQGEPATQGKKESSVHETLEEDALFVLLPEQGQWKIYERREGWQP